jgi:hypothetical protein
MTNEHADMRDVARAYLSSRYARVFDVRQIREYTDGSRLYGTLFGADGAPRASVRVHADGTIHGTPESARTGHM